MRQSIQQITYKTIKYAYVRAELTPMESTYHLYIIKVNDILGSRRQEENKNFYIVLQVSLNGIYGYSNIPICYYKAVQSWYARRMNFHFDIDDIFYMPGTHTAIAKCISLFSNVNDGVIVLTPSYSYHSDVEPINRKYIKVEMINNNGYYTIDFDAFEKACKEKDNTIFILCNPHNPTGRVFNIEELQRIGKICKENNVLIISDEVHSDLIRKDVTFHPIMNVIDTNYCWSNPRCITTIV